MKKFFKKITSFLILLAADVLVIILSFTIAISVRDFLDNFIALPLLSTADWTVYVFAFWWMIPLYVIIFMVDGLYTKHRPFWQETKVMIRSIALASLFVYATVSLGKIDLYFSRVLFVLHPLVLLVVLPVTRRILKDFLFRLGYWIHPIVELRIDTTYSLFESFLRNRFIGYHIVQSIQVSLESETQDEIIQKATQALQQQETKTLLITVREFGTQKVSELVERLYFIADHVIIVPESMELDVLNADVYHLMYDNKFVFDIQKGLNNPFNLLVKRTFDLVTASLALMFLTPILLLIALKVYLTDGFPIFVDFHQRFGRKGKLFIFYKFRTMRKQKYPDENYDIVREFVKNDPVKLEMWEKYQKIENEPNDPRILKGMNFLRRTSLDELAQFLNVLKGDMSIVGPRPFMPREKDLMGDYFTRVLAAKPGITDLWTINGRDSLTFEQRLKMSTWYIQNWSLWLDMVILAKTVQQVIFYFLKWSKKSKKISTNT
ncbi:MAG: sugar transferase [Candidatus Dojkabacteria bacterium]|nr:MAG: sugar transferase [Candidatus Dojkabacteria bacterium]